MTQRLYPTIKPSRYDVTLQPYLDTFTFDGEETVSFTLNEDTRTITFHAVELDIHKVWLEEGERKLIPTVSSGEDTVTFTFQEELSKGEKILHITFSGIINERLEGWYRSEYEVNGKKQYLATSHFEEIGARRVFPSIDEPSA